MQNAHVAQCIPNARTKKGTLPTKRASCPRKERKLELETGSELHLEYAAARIDIIDQDLTKGCTGSNLIDRRQEIRIERTVQSAKLIG